MVQQALNKERVGCFFLICNDKEHYIPLPVQNPQRPIKVLSKKKVFLLFGADDLESLFVGKKKAFSSIFASSS